jgi:hypothetical protein
MTAKVPSKEDQADIAQIDAAFLRIYGCTHGECLRLFHARYDQGNKDYGKGYTAGQNKAKGRKPANPGKPGPPRRISDGVASLLPHAVAYYRNEHGMNDREAATQFLEAMKIGTRELRKTGWEPKAEPPLPSPKQALNALYRQKKHVKKSERPD